jgi:hypothetical protein
VRSRGPYNTSAVTSKILAENYDFQIRCSEMFSGSSSSYGRMLDCGAIVGKERSWPTAGEGVHEGFYEGLARQNIVAHLFQCQLGFRRRHTWVSVWSHMGFSHRRSVLRPLFRTLHGLLRYQRSSALFRPVCLSSTCLSSTCLSSTCLSSTCLSITRLSITFCRSDWLANSIACASFPRLTLPPL